jgi:hypothetical protein
LYIQIKQSLFKLIIVAPNSTETLEFSDADLLKMDIALAMLEEVFSAKIISINTGLRKEEMLSASPEFDIMEWTKNDKIRSILGGRAIRLEKIADKIVKANKAILKRCCISFA